MAGDKMGDGNRKSSYAAFVASLAIVGTIGVLRRFIPMDSALLAFYRGLIGGLSLLTFVWLSRRGQRIRIPRRSLVLLIVNGGCLGFNWILFFEAFNYTSVSRATLCYYMQPTIVMLLSPLVFGEKLTRRKLACAAVSLIGMVFVSGTVGGEATGGSNLKGICLALGAACFYSVIAVMNKKITGVDPYSKTVIQLFAAAVTLIPYILATDAYKGVSYDAGMIFKLLVIGVVYTGLVYVLYFGSMEGMTAQSISTLSYIDPVVAMMVSALILGEGMSVYGMTGAAMIIGAAIISEK